jgi:hypothetical protein
MIRTALIAPRLCRKMSNQTCDLAAEAYLSQVSLHRLSHLIWPSLPGQSQSQSLPYTLYTCVQSFSRQLSVAARQSLADR